MTKALRASAGREGSGFLQKTEHGVVVGMEMGGKGTGKYGKGIWRKRRKKYMEEKTLVEKL